VLACVGVAKVGNRFDSDFFACQSYIITILLSTIHFIDCCMHENGERQCRQCIATFGRTVCCHQNMNSDITDLIVAASSSQAPQEDVQVAATDNDGDQAWAVTLTEYVDDHKPRGNDWSSLQGPFQFSSKKKASDGLCVLLLNWMKENDCHDACFQDKREMCSWAWTAAGHIKYEYRRNLGVLSKVIQPFLETSYVRTCLSWTIEPVDLDAYEVNSEATPDDIVGREDDFSNHASHRDHHNPWVWRKDHVTQDDVSSIYSTCSEDSQDRRNSPDKFNDCRDDDADEDDEISLGEVQGLVQDQQHS
jgi:hypothetical protein